MLSLDTLHLKDRINYIKGGYKVLVDGDGFAKAVPIRYVVPSSCGDNYWEPDWDSIGRYPRHRLYTSQGSYVGNVNQEPKLKKLWEQDEEQVIRWRNTAIAVADSFPAARKPTVTLERLDGRRETLEEVKLYRSYSGSVDKGTVYCSEMRVNGIKVSTIVDRQLDGIPVVVEQKLSRGTYVGGSVGAGGGFYVR